MIAVPQSFRSKRVAALIQREVAVLLLTDYASITKELITVVDVTLGKDLAHARIFVSVMGDEPAAVSACLNALNARAFDIRRTLAGLLKLRAIPQLRFYYDPSIREGNRIATLIEQAVKK